MSRRALVRQGDIKRLLLAVAEAAGRSPADYRVDVSPDGTISALPISPQAAEPAAPVDPWAAARARRNGGHAA